MTAFIGGSSQLVGAAFMYSRGRKMVPTFMLREVVRKDDGKNDALRGYLRTEYGSPDRAWLMVDAVQNDGGRPKAGIAAGMRSWFARRSRSDAPRTSEVSQ